jgi:predicted DsbA family dithiol-disulfide isomerase
MGLTFPGGGQAQKPDGLKNIQQDLSSLKNEVKTLAEKDVATRAPALGLDAARLEQWLSSTRYSDEIGKATSEAEGLGISSTPFFLIGTVEANSHVVKIKNTIMGAYPYVVFKPDLDNLVLTPKQ